MKNFIIVITIFILFVGSFINPASANADYDHDELMQYEGYGKAMYESIVEQSTYMTGTYTDNKEYVRESINEIKDYASFWYGEATDLHQVCYDDNYYTGCLGEIVERGGGLVLTVGDWIKNLFNDYNQANPEPEVILPNYEDAYGACLVYENQVIKYKSGNGCIVSITTPSGFVFEMQSTRNNSMSAATYEKSLTAQVAGAGLSDNYVVETYETIVQAYDARSLANSSFNGIMDVVQRAGFSVQVTIDKQLVVVQGDRRVPQRDVVNYIRDNSVNVPLPQIAPILVCPDGTTIKMAINGSTFIAVDGTVMAVAKDGTAQVNGEICNLNWQKPTVDYNPQGQPVVTNPDGTKTNLDTGDKTTKPPSATDLEGCESVLCGIGKVLDGLGAVVGAVVDGIQELLEWLLDKLLDLFKFLFIPDTEMFYGALKEMRTTLVEKLKIDEFKRLFDGLGGGASATSLDVEETGSSMSVMSARSTGGDMFASVTTDNIVNVGFFEMHMDTIHGWVRGFVYPFIIFYNINQMYKLVRGVNLVGTSRRED